MSYSLKRFLLACLLLAVAGVQSVRGFALYGPINEAYQVNTIGYNESGRAAAFEDIGGIADGGAPKNIGQGYRWNVPTVFYTYDATFLGFFGSNGVAAVDAAYSVLNSLTNVSSYSSNLSEWPLNSSQYNYTAQNLNLIDLKSATLTLMMEQLGLAQPDRWTWCLHDRNLPAGASCPNYVYTVIQRNYDPVTQIY
ncbi:MAG TPA: hypothetical protein VFC07_07115, partial [Verrucomicrobiae bacterium]|nr:hypothetical protein [Verrucomicrobiae bacterium]